MSYITATGNLAGTPELRDGERGAYTYARILVTDRIRNGEQWVDGPTTAYDVAVNGQQAEQLVEIAQRDGNVRVVFGGSLRTEAWQTEDGSKSGVNRTVRADFIGIAISGQSVSVTKRQTASNDTDETF